MNICRRSITAFALLISTSAFALSGADGFLVIPTAPLLAHQHYQIESQLGYHMSEHSGVLADRHPYVSGFRFGLFDRFELGMAYGDEISLDARMKLIEEDGHMPALSVGMRQLNASQEAYFYSVPENQRQAQAGEFFLSASLGNDWTRGHAGLSIFSGLDSGKACPFWGVEQKAFAGTSVLYEGFFRDRRTHHNAAIQWTFADVVTITAGATEFFRYFVQDGEFGFHIKSTEHAESGYRAPGVYAAITLSGFMADSPRHDTRSDLDDARKRLAAQEAQLQDLQARMAAFEALYHDNLSGQADSLQKRMVKTAQAFDSIVSGYQADVWDIDDLRKKQGDFVALGVSAQQLLLRTVQKPNANLEDRIVAVRVMAFSKEARYVPMLTQLLDSDSDESLRREAALALGNIATPEAKTALTTALPRTSGNLQTTLQQILAAFAP